MIGWCGAERIGKHAAKIARTHGDTFGESVDTEILMQMLEQPVDHFAHAAFAARLRVERRRKLRLIAWPLDVHDQLAGNGQGSMGAEVFLDQGEGQIDARGQAARGIVFSITHE